MIINRKDLEELEPVQPFIKYKEADHGVSYGNSEAGYDIRIDQTITFNSCLFGLIRWTTIKGEQGPKTRQIGHFVLASTKELFNMPSNCVGVVHDKSTWARRGLSVFNTVIEPGWQGYLTLELVYHGKKNLTIKRGSGIAQVLFHETSQEATYNGKYMNQPKGPVPAKESK